MRDLIATVFEVIGLLFLAAAAGVAAAQVALWAGLVAVAVTLLVEAVVLTLLEPKTPAGDDG